MLDGWLFWLMWVIWWKWFIVIAEVDPQLSNVGHISSSDSYSSQSGHTPGVGFGMAYIVSALHCQKRCLLHFHCIITKIVLMTSFSTVFTFFYWTLFVFWLISATSYGIALLSKMVAFGLIGVTSCQHSIFVTNSACIIFWCQRQHKKAWGGVDW